MTTKNLQATTTLAYSPRKSRLIIDVIRGTNLAQALEYLKTMNKGQTKKVYNLLLSAATNLGLTEAEYSGYKIGTIFAEEAQKLYRVMPRARGSAFRIRRRYSRLKVGLQKI